MEEIKQEEQRGGNRAQGGELWSNLVFDVEVRLVRRTFDRVAKFDEVALMDGVARLPHKNL